MFGSKKKQPRLEDYFAPAPPPPLPTQVIVRESEYRPCYVYGRKAIFHRWANDARPQLPYGGTPGENARYYQYRSTKAIVEYEDGTVGRVWPQEVVFADGGKFAELEWLPQEKETEERVET